MTRDSKPPSDTRQQYKKLTSAVFATKPVLREIVETQGSVSLYDYAHDYIRVSPPHPLPNRKQEFLQTFQTETAKRVGADIALSATKQLEQYYTVSTADHHGPICHPFFLNSNLVAAAPYVDATDPLLQNVIVLPCGNVSLNNSSFPRGILFTALGTGGNAKQQKLSFLPSNSHAYTIFGFRPYQKQEVEKMYKLLRERVSSGEVSKEVGDRVQGIIKEIYDQPDVLAMESFSDQMTKTDVLFWKKLFGSHAGKAPNLVYLEQETLVVELLYQYHLDHDTEISRILFNDAVSQLAIKHLDGRQGAFSLKERTGTFFFWALTEDGRRIQLWKNGRVLTSDDGVYTFELTPRAIRSALMEGKIMPSMTMVYSVLCFYYGVSCLGGFSQVNYLTALKEGWIEYLTEAGSPESAHVAELASTRQLCGDVTVAFLKSPDGTLPQATGLDLMLYGNDTTWPTIYEMSKQLTIEEALAPTMPEFYKIIYPEVERDPALTSITSQDILSLFSLEQKIKPCASLH